MIFLTFGSNTMSEIKQQTMIVSFAADIPCEMGCNESQTLRFQQSIISQGMHAFSRQQEAALLRLLRIGQDCVLHGMLALGVQEFHRFNGEWPHDAVSNTLQRAGGLPAVRVPPFAPLLRFVFGCVKVRPHHHQNHQNPVGVVDAA
jgi:hypothetical protein